MNPVLGLPSGTYQISLNTCARISTEIGVLPHSGSMLTHLIGAGAAPVMAPVSV